MSHNPQHIAAANLASLGLKKLNEYGPGGRGRRAGGGGRGGRFGGSEDRSASKKPIRKRTLERKLKRAKGTNRQIDSAGHAIQQVARLQAGREHDRLRAQVTLEGGDLSSLPKKPKKIKSLPPPVKKAKLLPTGDGSEAAPLPEVLMNQQAGVDENGEKPWDIDEEMRFYEQQLGVRRLKKKRKKAPTTTSGGGENDDSDDADLDEGALGKLRRELAEDGLGDLFDFVTMLEDGETPNVPLAQRKRYDEEDEEEDEQPEEENIDEQGEKGMKEYSLEKQKRILAKEAEIDRKQDEMEEALNKAMKKEQKKRAKAAAAAAAAQPDDDEEEDDIDEEIDDDMAEDDDDEDEDGDEEMEDEDDDDDDDEDESMEGDENEEDEVSAKPSRKRPRSDDEEEDGEEEDDDDDDEDADGGEDAETATAAAAAAAPKFDLYGFNAPTPDSLVAFRRGDKNILSSDPSASSTAAAQSTSAAASGAPAAPTKYVPPHLRAAAAAAAAAAGAGSSSNEANVARLSALRRQLKGLLNRLTTQNLEHIAIQISEQLYKQHSKREVTDLLCDEMLNLCTSESDGQAGFVVGSNSSTLLASSALVVYLHATLGSDIGAHFLEKFVLTFRDLEWKAQMNGNGDGASNPITIKAKVQSLKSCTTLITFLTYLYNFELISSQLLYELIRKFVDDFRSESIEYLLVVLQNCGYQLRKQDPTGLKEIILLVQNKAKVINAKMTASKDVVTDPSTTIPEGRVSFMLDMIYDLKNNKKRHSAMLDSITPLQNWLSSKLKRKKSDGGELQLRVGWKDILDIDTKGRWWLVGSAWKGHRHGEEAAANGPDGKKSSSAAAASDVDDRKKDTKVALPIEEGSDQVDLLSLAKSQHMNTDLRKSLFLIVMSAVDYMDAYEKICKLNLPPAQVRQVIKVLIDCCANEAKYNPYYSYLALQLCRMDGGKEFKFTLQLCLWDLTKEWSDESISKEIRLKSLRGDAKDTFLASKNRQALNVSKLLALLLRETSSGNGGGGLTLNWFKIFNFHEISSLQLLFLTSCLKDLLLHSEVSHLNTIMLRLHTQIYEKKKSPNPSSATAGSDSNQDWNLLRDGLDFFLQQHLTQTSKMMLQNVKTKEQGQLLKQRIALCRKAIQGQVDEDWMFKK